jgi:hypothetical protein
MPNVSLKLYRSFSVDVFNEAFSDDVRYEIKDNGKLISKIFNGFVYIQQDLLTEKNVLDVYVISRHLANNDIAGLVNVCKNEREYDNIAETKKIASDLSAYVN